MGAYKSVSAMSLSSSRAMMTNLYEVSNIPTGDPYRSTPLYGRYKAADSYAAPMTLSPTEVILSCGLENDMILDYPNG